MRENTYPPIKVSYDPRAITLNGERFFLLSGAIHYPRATPEQWPDLIARCREAGLNTIETYVFWNLHERVRGTYDFAGRLDLPRFCELVRDAGMYLVLRIGPYICAETNYGGLPLWLRDIPDIQFRTHNAPWQREMARWTRTVADLLHDYRAANGGPIILAQIENEYNLVAATYGDDGQRYLAWSAEFAASLGMDLPWVMCVGGAPGTIETLNGFDVSDQIEPHRRAHPDQPMLWTELWTGWYDTWSVPHHQRDAREIAFAATRFIAAGGTGINYYMWYGGTNFDREGMFLQTTSYDYDAPLDAFGRPTTKARHLARLHQVIEAHKEALLSRDGPRFDEVGGGSGIWSYGDLAFLVNSSTDQPATLTFAGRTHTLSPHTALIVHRETVLFRSDAIHPEDQISYQSSILPTVDLQWESWPEPIGIVGPTLDRPIFATPAPVDQLALTKDRSDYCWYTTSFTLAAPVDTLRFTLDGYGDLAHCFVDGRLVATTADHAPREERGFFDDQNFKRVLVLPSLAAGEHTLALLGIGLGLIKGDWVIGHHNMVHERKGIWGQVLLDDVALPGPWRQQPMLRGEAARIWGEGGALVAWSPMPTESRPLTWWRGMFAQPVPDAPLLLDLVGMTRGLIWLNGQCVGRYWTVAGQRASLVPRYANPVSTSPTQRAYALPAACLRPLNQLVLFDELGGDPTAIQLIRP